jgi:hypothetical protein
VAVICIGGGNHRPVASHWHHKMLYRVYLVWAGFELTDCTGSYKFNYHTITITTAPIQWGTGGLTERCARFVTTERLAGNNWCPVVYSLNPTYSRLSSLSLDGKGHDIRVIRMWLVMGPLLISYVTSYQ